MLGLDPIEGIAGGCQNEVVPVMNPVMQPVMHPLMQPVMHPVLQYSVLTCLLLHLPYSTCTKKSSWAEHLGWLQAKSK